MKTNKLTPILSRSILTLAGFALAGCGAVDPADLGEGLGNQGVAENREPMGNATAVETAPNLTARPDSVRTTTASAPDLYELGNGQIHVSYSTSSLDGQPHFTYQDGHQRLGFKGDEIRTATSELGTLVTVSIRVTIDSGSTSFTLLVPHVGLDASNSAPIETQGITATHKFSALPHANEGQTELYTVTALSGTARFVLF